MGLPLLLCLHGGCAATPRTGNVRGGGWFRHSSKGLWGTWVGAHRGVEMLGWGSCHGRIGVLHLGSYWGEVSASTAKGKVAGSGGGWLVGMSVGLAGRDSKERAQEHWVCHMLPK